MYKKAFVEWNAKTSLCFNDHVMQVLKRVGVVTKPILQGVVRI